MQDSGNASSMQDSSNASEMQDSGNASEMQQKPVLWQRKKQVRRQLGGIYQKRAITFSSSPCNSPMSSPVPSASTTPTLTRRRCSNPDAMLSVRKKPGSALPDLLQPADIQHQSRVVGSQLVSVSGC